MDLILASVFKKNCGQLFSKSHMCSSRIQTQPIRATGGRSDCNPDGNKPRCSPELLKLSPCAKKKREREGEKTSPFKSIWENPECCKDPCPNFLPRFDDMYYQISDKATRKYQRTWKECPQWKILPKVVCNFEELDGPPPCERRSLKEKPKTACIPEGCDTKKNNVKCLTISLPGCKPSRFPPSCHIVRRPSDCKKICAPYPAFSECNKPKQKALKPSECRCLNRRSQCCMFAYWRKLLMHKAKAAKS